MRAARHRAKNPAGLPRVWGGCKACRHARVVELDTHLSLGWPVKEFGLSPSTVKGHRAEHLWGWILDRAVNALHARALVVWATERVVESAGGVGWVGVRQRRVVAALEALARLDAHLEPQGAAMMREYTAEVIARQGGKAAAGRVSGSAQRAAIAAAVAGCTLRREARRRRKGGI